ncbi:MAG: hypothetical protein KF861_22685, partial [Planctomycetaceae bacterium]|nr:hypothetical protein [Planctomycetaceae bacterium]
MTSLLSLHSFRLLVQSPWIPRIGPVATGALTGTVLFVWAHQFLATFGTSLPVTAGMAMALTGGLSLGWLVPNLRRPPMGSLSGRAVSWLILAAWTVVFPWLLTAGRQLLSGVPVRWLEEEALVFLVMLAIACFLFVVPAAAIIRLGLREPLVATRSDWSARFVAGCGLSLGLTPIFWATWMAVDKIGFVVAGCAVLGFWFHAVRVSDSHQGTVGKAADSSEPSLSPAPGLSWVCAVSFIGGLLLP